MNIQLLSDLHLESEVFDPQPVEGADVLVLAGDIDSSWRSLEQFARWPCPVLYVAGNHEFDDRELDEAWPALRAHCASLGITLLERESLVLRAPDGRRIRFVATVRWCDFDVFGPAGRDRAMRAGVYFQNEMRATCGGMPFDVAAVRLEAQRCRAWLQSELAPTARQAWDNTVVLTHFAPSLACADPRYGSRPSTACFCNADDDLMRGVDLWLHGHVHARHDFSVIHADGRRTRVVSQARGLEVKGEVVGYDAGKLVEV